MTNGIVHQIQRLGGNGRRRPLADDEARIGEIEERQRLGHQIADNRQIDGAVRIGRDGRPGQPRKRKPTLPSPLRCHRAALGRRRGRAGRASTSMVSRSASASRRRFGIRQTSTLSGSASKFFASNCDDKLIGPAEDDRADELLDRPAVFHEGEGQVIEQGRDGWAFGRRRRSCRAWPPGRGRSGAARRGWP